MQKLTKEEFDAILEIILRICREYDMCHHEGIIWLQKEIYSILKWAENRKELEN